MSKITSDFRKKKRNRREYDARIKWQTIKGKRQEQQTEVLLVGSI